MLNWCFIQILLFVIIIFTVEFQLSFRIDFPFSTMTFTCSEWTVSSQGEHSLPWPLQWVMSPRCCVTCSSRGAVLCKWLPVDCGNSAAINQVMANIFQIKFKLQQIRSPTCTHSPRQAVERVACLPSRRKVLILLSIRESVCSPAGPSHCGGAWWLTALTFCFPRPRGAKESCFLGALRSSNGPQWTPQEIIELSRSRLCPPGVEGFIYFILSYFSFCSGSKRRKSIQQNCDIFSCFPLVHLWQHSGNDGIVQSLYSNLKKKKKYEFQQSSLKKRTSCNCKQQRLSQCVTEIFHQKIIYRG